MSDSIGKSPEEWQLKFRMFRALLKSWQSVFTDAAEFATMCGPSRVVSISHSEDKNEAIVTVWYWSD